MLDIVPISEERLSPKEFFEWALSNILAKMAEDGDLMLKSAVNAFMPLINMKLRRMTEDEAKEYCKRLITICDAIAEGVERGVILD